jgi:hypothetical protein
VRQYLSFIVGGKACREKSQGQNRVREILPLGIAGRLTETWAMEKAKRAVKQKRRNSQAFA